VGRAGAHVPGAASLCLHARPGVAIICPARALLQVFLDGPPGHVPEGRVQVSDPIQADLRLQPTEVYTTQMGALLRGPLAKVRPALWRSGY